MKSLPVSRQGDRSNLSLLHAAEAGVENRPAILTNSSSKRRYLKGPQSAGSPVQTIGRLTLVLAWAVKTSHWYWPDKAFLGSPGRKGYNPGRSGQRFTITAFRDLLGDGIILDAGMLPQARKALTSLLAARPRAPAGPFPTVRCAHRRLWLLAVSTGWIA